MDYSADYWEKRYTMRPDRIPIFLNDLAQTILRTGKYFNVIRQCGTFFFLQYFLYVSIIVTNIKLTQEMKGLKSKLQKLVDFTNFLKIGKYYELFQYYGNLETHVINLQVISLCEVFV